MVRLIRFPVLHDKKQLQELAYRYSDTEIAGMLKCGRSTVQKARVRFGIPRTVGRKYERTRPELHDRTWLEDHKNVPSKQLADELGCSAVSIDNAYSRAGIRRKRPRQVIDRGGTLYELNGEVLGTREAVEHYMKRKSCFDKLAARMLSGKWHGEWCDEKDIKRARIKRDLREMGFGWNQMR